MRKTLMWLWLLNKRLYKKTTFIIILLLIPALVFALGIVADRDSGFIHIALARTEDDDRLSADVVNSLIDDSRLINFISCSSPDEAEEMVLNGKADAAWIFKENATELVQSYVKTRSSSDSVVRIVEREQTIPLRLSHEKLTSAIYKHCSKAMYLSYIRENAPDMNDITDNELLTYYNDFTMTADLFEFSYPDSSISTDGAKTTGYLLAPIRGLLSILVLLCGMASVMFFIQDKRSGTFSWVPESRLSLVAFAYHIIAIMNVAIIMVISLFITGLATSVIREIIMLILYCLCCASFCLILQKLCRSVNIVGAVIPLLTVVLIAVCPVFFDFKSIRWLQLLLPPTHYINSAHSTTSMLYMALYSASIILIVLLSENFSAIKRRFF